MRKAHVIPVGTGNDKRWGGWGRAVIQLSTENRSTPTQHTSLSLVITPSNDDNGEDPDNDKNKQAEKEQLTHR